MPKLVRLLLLLRMLLGILLRVSLLLNILLLLRVSLIQHLRLRLVQEGCGESAVGKRQEGEHGGAKPEIEEREDDDLVPQVVVVKPDRPDGIDVECERVGAAQYPKTSRGDKETGELVIF